MDNTAPQAGLRRPKLKLYRSEHKKNTLESQGHVDCKECLCFFGHDSQIRFSSPETFVNFVDCSPDFNVWMTCPFSSCLVVHLDRQDQVLGPFLQTELEGLEGPSGLS